MENTNQQQDEKVKDISKRVATIKFHMILEKGKEIRILPGLLNLKYLSGDEINRLKIVEVLISSIKIPPTPKPWSEISDKADVVFLLMQSRRDWGEEIDENTILLHVKKIRDLVEKIEESVNHYSFNADFQSGKFNHTENSEQPEKETPPQTKPVEKQKSEEGTIPGSTW